MGGERIIFSAIGTRPFTGSVFSIGADGGDPHTIFEAQWGRSYTFASVQSLNKPILATVSEFAPGDARKVINRLYLYTPETGEWRSVLPQSTPQGSGTLSPDGNGAVYLSLRPGTPRPGESMLSVVDLRTGEHHPVFSRDGSGVLSPAWSISGNIAFVRTFWAAGALYTELMELPSGGGEPRQILPTKDGVTLVTYSPDGQRMAVLTNRGVEVLTTGTGERRVLLGWDAIGKEYISRTPAIGGLAWSMEGQIAFALTRKSTGACELWVVGEDGSNSRVIYSVNDVAILAVSGFVDSNSARATSWSIRQRHRFTSVAYLFFSVFSNSFK